MKSTWCRGFPPGIDDRLVSAEEDPAGAEEAGQGAPSDRPTSEKGRTELTTDDAFGGGGAEHKQKNQHAANEPIAASVKKVRQAEGYWQEQHAEMCLAAHGRKQEHGADNGASLAQTAVGQCERIRAVGQ
ncbi:MAG: hypothetical protein L0Y44_00310 [Phycisphaerales bacterium]|nr:hypothetical protein [Phycisphaerales bacterium]MCI0675623.1 hypothetical protein [Phycisphaerales bacterium]